MRSSALKTRTLTFLLSLFISSTTYAQHFSIGLEKMNVFYLGVDNPVTIAVENTSCKELIVKTSNGTITGSNGQYIFNGIEAGATEIIIYRCFGKKLKKIGTSSYRVKKIPLPVFKIGPYAYGRNANRVIVASQQFVRADYDNFDFDIKALVDSFHVTIIKGQSVTTTYFNISGKINQDIHNAFTELAIGDKIIFDKIFVTGPANLKQQLDPLFLNITE